MVTMSTVWDRSTQVMSGRFGMLATIAGLLSVLPTMLQAMLVQARVADGSAMTPGAITTIGMTFLLVSIVLLVCAIWSSLSLTAAASSPAIDSAGAALGAGAKRLPLAIGLSLLIGLVAAIAIVPMFMIVGTSAMNLAALQSGNLARALTPNAALGFALYMLVILVVGLWLSARLFLFNAVLVNEHRGIGSFARSFELTRGLTWRLIGVLLLFLVVFLVLSLAVGSVAGVVFGLVFGSSSPATAVILSRLVGALVSAGFAIVVSTFAAQLYRAIAGMEATEAFQ